MSSDFDAHKQRFRSQGYTVMKGVFPEEELVPMRTRTEQIIHYALRNNCDLFTNYYLRHRVDQGVLYDLFQRFPEFPPLARHPAIVTMLQNIYARNFFLYENSLVYKPPRGDNAVPWHQDFMNRADEPFKVIVWMALDDVDEENGCIYAIPGSHLTGYRSWYKVRGETHHTRLRLDDLDLSRAVPLTLRAGDVLIFHCALLHSSKNVHSERPRRAYRVAYQSFTQTYTPRGSPIVISMLDDSDLTRVCNYEPNSLVRLLHKVGDRLKRL